MEFNFGNKIDINAEKSILNEAIVASQPKVEFNSPTELKLHMDFPEQEMMKNPFSSTDSFKFNNEPIKSYNTFENNFSTENMSKIDSLPTKMNFENGPIASNSDYGPSAINFSSALTPSPVVGTPAEFKKIMPSSDVYEEALQKTKNIQKQLQNDLMPTIQNMANQMREMSVSKSDRKTLTEERPTIPPTNLIFLDRVTKASSPPVWA